NLAYTGSAINSNTIQVVSANSTLNLAGTAGQYAPGVGNSVLWTSPDSLTLNNGLAQTLTNGSLTITTAALIGQAEGTATVTASAGVFSINNAGADLTIQPDAAGQTTVINLNGGTVTVSGTSVSVLSAAKLSSDHDFTITTPLLTVNTSGV